MANGVAIQKKYFTQERKWIVMEQKEQNAPNIEQNARDKKKIFEHPIVAGLCVALASSVTSVVLSNLIYHKVLDVRLNNIANDIALIRGDVSSVKDDVSGFKQEMFFELSSIKYDIGVLQGKTSDVVSIELLPEGDLYNFIATAYKSDQTVYLSEGKNVDINVKQIIATDAKSGVPYTGEDLVNETILMSYTDEDGQEVLFKGKFDENGYWNENCIINKYKDGNLVMIMDAVYESGNLVNYEQIFPYTTLAGNDVWVISRRAVEEESRSGETFMYFRKKPYIKDFNSASISDTDFINVSGFKNMIDLQIEGYYSGYTSNGKFNDDTGSAYLVKYKENGDVRFFYVGKIKDGLANDSTGNAWSLSWGYADDGYYYFKGTFHDGTHDTPKNWKPITQEEIDSLVNPDDFNCSLKGLLSSST